MMTFSRMTQAYFASASVEDEDERTSLSLTQESMHRPDVHKKNAAHLVTTILLRDDQSADLMKELRRCRKRVLWSA